MRRVFECTAGMAVMLGWLAVASGAETERTLAVLDVDGGRSATLVELVTAELQEDASLAFVERERMGLISAEQSLALAGWATKGRGTEDQTQSGATTATY